MNKLYLIKKLYFRMITMHISSMNISYCVHLITANLYRKVITRHSVINYTCSVVILIPDIVLIYYLSFTSSNFNWLYITFYGHLWYISNLDLYSGFSVKEKFLKKLSPSKGNVMRTLYWIYLFNFLQFWLFCK